jgi:glyoxylase-like metal-dependent hydrolase (beta-lactamase superfamily II)
MSLTVGEREFRIVSMPPDKPHSEHAVVYFPADKTLFLGELYENHFFPRIGARNIRQWIELLRQVEGWDIDTYVPGHGAPGNKKDLVDFRKFLEWLTAQVEMRLKKGKSVAEVQKELVLPKVYNWHAPELAAEDVEEACRQLSPAPTASAGAPSAPAGAVSVTPPDPR